MTIMNGNDCNSQTDCYDRRIQDDYIIMDVIGYGSFSQVMDSFKMPRNDRYAIKCYSKALIGDKKEVVDREINIIKGLSHPNIIRFFDYYESPRHIYLVLEYAAGGELFDRIVSNGNYSEKDTSKLTLEILSALDYLHSHNIVHRDLKPENLLYYGPEDDSRIMISDFGLAAIDTDSSLTGVYGSPNYLAPEIINNKKYGRAVDLWSLGVIVYALLCSSMPFDEESKDELFEKITKANYQFSATVWNNVTENAKNFIRQLLQIDPEQRLSCKEALKHEWHYRASTVTILSLSELVIESEANAMWKSSASGTTAAQLLRSWTFNKQQPTEAKSIQSNQKQEYTDEGYLSQSPFSLQTNANLRKIISNVCKGDSAISEDLTIDNCECESSVQSTVSEEELSIAQSTSSEEEDNEDTLVDIGQLHNGDLTNICNKGLIAA